MVFKAYQSDGGMTQILIEVVKKKCNFILAHTLINESKTKL